MSEHSFGRIRGFLWPIHGYEMKKFLPLFIMLFLVTFNYSFLRSSKDVLMISKCGIKSLAFLKLYVVLPGAILYTLYYSYLLNKLPRERVFYWAIAPFLFFFTIFGLIFYPYASFFEPNFLLIKLETYFKNPNIHVLLNMIRNWPITLYYLMAELWGGAALSLLFWGFTNSITSLKQSKRFYALLSIGANIGLALSGPYMNWLKTISNHNYDLMVLGLIKSFVISTACILGIYYWIQKNVVSDPSLVEEKPQTVAIKKKEKKSLKESMIILFSSKHLIYISILVIAYGLTINLVEFIWKHQVVTYFNLTSVNQTVSLSQMQLFFSNTQTITGILSIFLTLFVSGQVERAFGWTTAALITPISILILSLLFFGISLSYQWNIDIPFLNTFAHPLYFVIIVGAIQNGLAKAAKYAIFDPTKEQSYFPLDDFGRTQGKVAVDVVGARLGKAGSSIILQVMMLLTGSIASYIPIIGLFIILVVLIWIYAVFSLGYKISEYEKTLEA